MDYLMISNSRGEINFISWKSACVVWHGMEEIWEGRYYRETLYGTYHNWGAVYFTII